KQEAVVVGAHLDHLGIRANASGDSIYNGADDDASGVVTVLEAARMLASGKPPRRTVIFIAFTGEEGGPSGSRWYIEHPVVPIASTVAQLQVEMVARPDSMVGGSGKAWLTGFERSTMGEMLAAAGIPVVIDPRPAQQYFRRSDNYRFALAGVPAHTLSSFGGHPDYHQPGDEAEKADYDHLAAVAGAAARAVRLLADGPRPGWKPGGRPEPVLPKPPGNRD
ncbi:MAG TPA: M20/M25/M40 family metallo-hydrolase, partial [Gemmatimonadales bacterium]